MKKLTKARITSQHLEFLVKQAEESAEGYYSRQLRIIMRLAETISKELLNLERISRKSK